MQARDLMSTNVTVVPPEMPVAAVVETLASRGISAVPVVGADGAPLGVVTEGDLIRRLAEEKPGPLGWFLGQFGNPGSLADRYAKAHGRTARDVMTGTLVTVPPEASAERIARLMEEKHVRRVLVVENGRLAGLVSRADLLRAILRPASGEQAQGDREILRAVLQAMREQPWTDTYWTYADVRDGVVSFHGYARDDRQRDGLRVLAQDIPGVRAVEDRMQPMPLMLRITL